MKYTLTEALVKLKLTDKKLQDTIPTLPVAFVCTGTNKVPNGFDTVEKYREKIKSELQSAQSLINFRQQIKDKVVLANAKTVVLIGNKTMTIAEAIEQKNSIKNKKNLLTVLKTALTRAETQVQIANTGIEQKADQYLVQMFATNPNASEALKQEARKGFVQNNQAILVTDDTLRNYVTSLEQEITDFESNVDVALSVVNAKTEIEV